MMRTLREFLHQKPFHPFRVIMRSGKRYDIVDPEKVAVGASIAYVFLPRKIELQENEIELVYVPRECIKRLERKDKAGCRIGAK